MEDTAIQVKDDVPTEDEIKNAVKRMRLHKTPGITGIKVENLRAWMNAAEHGGDCTNWEKVINLVQLAFTDNALPQLFGKGILVLIPKSVKGEYRGIALLDVVYKLVSTIINTRINNVINYHEAIHGFRKGRGTTTAISELKILMSSTMKDKKSNPRFMIFMDLTKAYDTLDRERTLQILSGYGVGKNVCRFINEIWKMDEMIPKQAGFYGKSFKASRGVRQGDIMSPTIFNMVCDAVIRHSMKIFDQIYPHANADTNILFYADDGVITSSNAQELQHLLDIITNAFGRVGLQMNVKKTKTMIMEGWKCTQRNRGGKNEPSYRDRMKETMKCPVCETEIKKNSFKKHILTKKCMTIERLQNITADNNNIIIPICQPCDNPDVQNISMDGTNDATCIVPNCTYTTNSPACMRYHFRNMHNNDTIIVTQEGRLNQCDKCGLFQKSVGIKHQQSKSCKSHAEKRELLKKQMENTRLASETIFTILNEPIENVPDFKYLGRTVTNTDDDNNAVDQNIKRASITWGRLRKVLEKGKMKNPRVATTIYKVVIQTLLLYGSETWKVTTPMLKRLENFHRRCARYITGHHIRQNEDAV
jgi:hypothetical protein